MKSKCAVKNRGNPSFLYQIQNRPNPRQAAGHICVLRMAATPRTQAFWGMSVTDTSLYQTQLLFFPFQVLEILLLFSISLKDYSYCFSSSWPAQLSVLHLGITPGTTEWNGRSQVWAKLTQSSGTKVKFETAVWWTFEQQGWMKLLWYPSPVSIWVLSYQLSAQLLARPHS